MRIHSQVNARRTTGREEQERLLPPVEHARDFSRLLEDKDKSAPGSDTALRQQRLTACFQTLLEGNCGWEDGSVSIRLSGHGRLQWRLLNGPLAGCSIFACWEGSHLSLEMVATGSLACQLARIRPRLESQLGRSFNRFFITLKVTRETGYV
ncbi:hypothetical protein MUA02_01215 [Enterobacteriaceae bacterium H20N1]|uniref:Uncharacterized protein n=1 Tax=Dryocola boscaweniae TaxID=2925397 RepID=A0A9X2W5F3_9ENTR|nr:hypothetical protein [Dryocola boscaweniae]MCT4700527.1 hypothetical protein [Dryocola boscaweniae]MCT4717683.1 hypothetical protein [Dryocola boscaweniae]